MAKLKLPTADSFMAMLDRIPQDDESVQAITAPTAPVAPLVAAPETPSPTPAPPAAALVIVDSVPQHPAITPSNSHTITPSNSLTVEPSNSNTVKQSNSRTVKQPHSKTVEQLNSRTVEPLDSETVKQSNSETVTPLDSDTVRQSDRNTVTQFNRAAVKRLDGHTVSPSNPTNNLVHATETVSQPNYQTVSQPNYQTVSADRIPLEVLTLSYTQASILEFLIQAGGVTTARSISEATHIGIPSVRDAINRLIKRGFIAPPVAIRNSTFQGFSYILNPQMVTYFQDAGGLEQDTYRAYQTVSQPPCQTVSYQAPQTVSQSNSQTVSPSHSPTVSQCNGNTAHSSSSLESQLTTTTNYQTVSQSDNPAITPSDRFVLSGPAGIFWVEEEKLSEGQAQKWCQDFEVEPAQMRQQLAWAQFDLEANGRRAEVKKDTISWFFGHLRKTGGAFPRPVNYKSPAELRAEAMEADLEQERAAKERIRKAELEKRFQQILANPTGPEYQALYNQANGFSRETGGEALIHALRDIFNGAGGSNAI